MNECFQCGGKCCIGIIEVRPEDEVYNDENLTVEYNGCRIMKPDSHGYCVALKEGLCSIHEKRPKICRDFAVSSPCCLLFREGKVVITRE